MARGRAVLRRAPRRPARRSPWSAPARPASPARTGWRCTATTSTIFEARPKAGGLNEYGIAAYKTPDDFAQAEVDYVTAIGGITIENGKALGRDFTLADLTANYDAVFLGMGLGGVNALRAEGEDADGRRGRRRLHRRAAPGRATSRALPVGRRVVVIGGGMTAIDAAVQSKLLGAEEVTIVYRRGKEQMNASEFEQDLAATKGVTIRHWLQPKRVVADGRQGHRHRARIHRSCVDGKLAGTGETTTLAADQVFKAIGQTLVDRRRGRSTHRPAARSRSMPRAAPRWPRSGPAATASPAATT